MRSSLANKCAGGCRVPPSTLGKPRRECVDSSGAAHVWCTRTPQQTVRGIDVYTDTDWAGCPKTRKSTSGGSLMLGSHTIKHWSSTQTSVALSSGEAEFAGVIRGAGQGLGYQALLKDLGIEVPLRVWTDSSAAIGICSRQGLGKLRHLDTHTLWIQQAVRLGRVDLRKIDGEVNPADLLTKHSLSRERLEALVRLHGCEYIGGRADSAPQARAGASNKTTMASAGGGSCVVGTLDGGERMPIMPHNSLSTAELDRDFPSIVAPKDEHLDDIVNDDDDKVLQAGLREVEKIRQTMRTQGRRRRPLREDSTHGTLSLCVEASTAASSTASSGPRASTVPALLRLRSAPREVLGYQILWRRSAGIRAARRRIQKKATTRKQVLE